MKKKLTDKVVIRTWNLGFVRWTSKKEYEPAPAKASGVRRVEAPLAADEVSVTLSKKAMREIILQQTNDKRRAHAQEINGRTR